MALFKPLISEPFYHLLIKALSNMCVTRFLKILGIIWFFSFYIIDTQQMVEMMISIKVNVKEEILHWISIILLSNVKSCVHHFKLLNIVVNWYGKASSIQSCFISHLEQICKSWDLGYFLPYIASKWNFCIYFYQRMWLQNYLRFILFLWVFRTIILYLWFSVCSI